MKRSFPIARLSGPSVSIAIAYGLLSFIFAGCAGNLDPSLQGGAGGSGMMGTGGMGATNCAQTVLTTNCAMSNCHNGVGVVYAGLNLTWPVDRAKVVGVMPSQLSACLSSNFLEPGVTPATGLLIDNLKSSTVKCGVAMPYLLNPLSDTDVACLQSWANDLVAGSQ
jgi:hypothetical protein